MTYGGPGSPQTLSYVPADGAWEYAIGHASFSDLQTAFPTGGYQFDLTGGAMGPATVALNYDGDAYSNVPEFSAASFAALQALNSDDPITLDFNAMDVSPNATPGVNTIVFSITNSSNATVFNEAFSPTDTSVTLPAFLLSPRQSYSFDLLFDDRITANDGGILLTQFYDTHTDGSIFTTAAIPEPSTWAMLLIGFAGLGFGGYRKARKRRRSPEAYRGWNEGGSFSVRRLLSGLSAAARAKVYCSKPVDRALAAHHKLFVTPLASRRESAMRRVWGRRRYAQRSNMATALRR